jgi:hypothetical protein
MNDNIQFHELPVWNRELLSRLLNADFPGQQELKSQISTATYKIIDANQSLSISPTKSVPGQFAKTIPVEASGSDQDGVLIQTLLFTRQGFAYMLEVLREDGNPVKCLPPASEFSVTVLAP